MISKTPFELCSTERSALSPPRLVRTHWERSQYQYRHELRRQTYTGGDGQESKALLREGLSVLHGQHVQRCLRDLVCRDGKQSVTRGHLNGAQGCGTMTISTDTLNHSERVHLHVGNLLQVALLEQRQEGNSDQVGAGDVIRKCRLEVRPFSQGSASCESSRMTGAYIVSIPLGVKFMIPTPFTSTSRP